MSVPETSPPALSDLDARFARLREEYDHRRQTAHALVRRWEWYSAEAYDLRPLWYERDLSRPGRRLAGRPPPDRDHHRIGFDSDGRPVVLEEYSGDLDGTLYYETFRDHLAGPGRVTAAHFRAGGEPIYLHEYRFEAERIGSATTVATRGGGCEEYGYTDDRVTRIVAYHAKRADKPDGRLRPLAPYQTIHARYDDAGLSRLEVAWAGPAEPRTELRYERPPAGFTLDEAVETVRRELVRQVPAVLRAMAIDEPVYAVALGYLAADPIGVSVHVGFESDRYDWLVAQAEDEAEDDTFVLWNPCDLRGLAPVDFYEAAETARLLRQELTLADADADADVDADADADVDADSDADADSDVDGPATSGVNERGRRLLCAAAAELNTQDWAGIVPVSNDFVVYAADWEMVDFERNLPECVPAAWLALLRDRDLL
ncbi:hypothetical protein I0C86_01375 [Plantactinospora sp. S1510]|uniref:Uncharacterized protein n=1 Tax=Plantactinospora alkalitolerans TaxID=2789879 RepID=A0ABS0GN89_9ACTN|nr:hypothetical protein [Plantactinospora alkalitolerans]MBF9127654.1 hypothetical protein [Plantactinospora alkalitolerans]